MVAHHMENVTKSKKKKWLRLVLIISGIMALCNLPGPSDFFEMWVDHNHYRFSNGDGTYTVIDNMFKNDRWRFKRKLIDPDFFAQCPHADSSMYRLFTKNPFAFWRYGKYFLDKRYTLPFAKWEDVKKRRTICKSGPYTFKEF
jgi:hypothetical protein